MAEYRSDPCRASSLPYWKTKNIVIPPSMKIIREDEFADELLDTYTDEPYFKLRHDLTGLEKPELPQGFDVVTPTPELLSQHISQCYERERLSVRELLGLQSHFTYHPELWIALVNQASGEVAATGIGGIDPEIGEGTLEWIQVSPAYRHRGLGKYMVCELLRRMDGKAGFVTVSGRLNNKNNPELLYQACGFQDRVVWHIMTQKRSV